MPENSERILPKRKLAELRGHQLNMIKKEKEKKKRTPRKYDGTERINQKKKNNKSGEVRIEKEKEGFPKGKKENKG